MRSHPVRTRILGIPGQPFTTAVAFPLVPVFIQQLAQMAAICLAIWKSYPFRAAVSATG